MTGSWTDRRWLWALWLSAAITLSSIQFGRTADDDPVEDGAANQTPPQLIQDPVLLKIKKGLCFIPHRSHLEEVLAWKIEEIELVHPLNKDEKDKLRLAGMSDVKRLLDRVQDLETSLQSQNPKIDVVGEWDSIQRLMKTGIFEQGSLLCKTQRQLLTAEQIAKLETGPVDVSTPWIKDFSEAQHLASTLRRPILLRFTAAWCGPSQKLERVMDSPAVLRVLRRKFVMVSVDIDKNPDLAKEHKLRNIPTVVVVAGDGKTLGRSEGLMDELEFMHALHFIMTEGGQEAKSQPN